MIFDRPHSNDSSALMMAQDEIILRPKQLPARLHRVSS
ncbi:hypothetical protein ACRB68_14880 [Actinomadura sp. RB68]|uniref:Uncharacterized protein n=1 Tax=Actinomadura macrotermitis TaxID=2585200 RepID=A0A7K0BQX5_9ACTN|nr:hypothetical protein [Actinomadura macrotermitis]